jgi:hypothetical protein
MEMARARESAQMIREKWAKPAPNGTAGNQWATPNLYSNAYKGDITFSIARHI